MPNSTDEITSLLVARRGGDTPRVSLEGVGGGVANEQDLDSIALDDALRDLLSSSAATVQRLWRSARAWLLRYPSEARA